jgi:NADH-quinone oxidoreductase subunit M
MTTELFVLLLPALPLFTAVAVALLGPKRTSLVRQLSLAVTTVGIALALVVAIAYCSRAPDTVTDRTFHPVFVTAHDLISIQGGSIQFFVGIDGLNVWLILLTAILMLPAVLVSWNAVTERTNEYYAWLLTLGAGLQAVFLSFDVVLFYVFFELTLVPLFFMIGIWGGPQRQYAARKFFIYTFAGSMITFLGVLSVVSILGTSDTNKRLTFSIPELIKKVDAHRIATQRAVETSSKALEDAKQRRATAEEIKTLQQRATDKEKARGDWLTTETWIFLALMVGFAIKVPLVPVHTWLPLAHTEAPTAGSVLLAGVLLKLGSYGFLRLCLPLTPEAAVSLGVPLIGTLSVIGIIYGAFCAVAQEDIKKLVAYSSVSHLGFCMLGMFALRQGAGAVAANEVGLSGSLMQMINHGLSTGGLFLLVGMLYERYHTRKMGDYGGMGARLKLLTVFMVFICLSSAGLPGLNGFIGESLVLFGSFGMQKDQNAFPMLAALAATGIVLGAWYLFTMLRRVFFGPVKEPHHEGPPIRDLDRRELTAIVPIALLCLIIGVHPTPILKHSQRDIEVVAKIVADPMNTHKPSTSASTPHR